MLQLHPYFGIQAAAAQWSVSLLRFEITGNMPFDIFILTREYNNKRISDLYYFSPVAKKAFYQWVQKYSHETKLEYTLKGVAL